MDNPEFKIDPEDFKKFMESNSDMLKQFEKLQNFDETEMKKGVKDLIRIWGANQKIQAHLESLIWAVRERFGMLSTVSALASTLLIVATFNNELIRLDNFVRVLLSILLILIPSGLWGLFYETGQAQKSSLGHIKEIMEKDINKEAALEIEKLGKKRSFAGLTPFFINLIFSAVIILIIILIWKNA